jgi:hypothetical protein
VSASLERAGVVVLGERHGVAGTAGAVGALARALDVRALAFEWSYDELGELVEDALSSGRLDLDRLWQLPADGDVFARDGRFTAGHVRLLEQLVAAGGLEQVILVDRLASGGAERERELAERLTGSLRAGLGVLAVVGHAHALRDADGASMFSRVERARPGVANGSLSYRTGRCTFRGEQDVRPIEEATDAVFELGTATPAVVPAK